MSREQDFFSIRPDLSRPTTAASSSKLVVDTGRSKPTVYRTPSLYDTSAYHDNSFHETSFHDQDRSYASLSGAIPVPASTRTSPHPTRPPSQSYADAHQHYPSRQRPASTDNLRSRASNPVSPIQRTWSSAKRRERDLPTRTPEGIPIPRRRSSLASVTRHKQVISLTEAYRIALEEDEGAVATDGDESYDDLEPQQQQQQQHPRSQPPPRRPQTSNRHSLSRGDSRRESGYHEQESSAYFDQAPSRPLSPVQVPFTPMSAPPPNTWDSPTGDNALHQTASVDQIGTIRPKKSKTLIKSPSITRGLRRMGSKNSITSLFSDDGKSPGASKTSRLRKLVPGLSRESSNASKKEKEKEKEKEVQVSTPPSVQPQTSKRNLLKRLVGRGSKDNNGSTESSPSQKVPPSPAPMPPPKNYEHGLESPLSPLRPLSPGHDPRYRNAQATPPSRLAHSQSYSGRSPSSRFSWHVDDEFSGIDLQTSDSPRVRISPNNITVPKRPQSTYEGRAPSMAPSLAPSMTPSERERTLRFSKNRLDEIRALEKAIEKQNGDGNEYLHHHVLTTTTTIIRPGEARAADDSVIGRRSTRQSAEPERVRTRSVSRSRSRDFEAASLRFRDPSNIRSPDRRVSEQERRDHRKSAPPGGFAHLTLAELSEPSETSDHDRHVQTKLADVQAREAQVRRTLGPQIRADDITSAPSQPRTRSLSNYNYRRRTYRSDGPVDDSMAGRVASPIASPRGDRRFWNDAPPTPPPKDTPPGVYRGGYQAVTPEASARSPYHEDSILEDSYRDDIRESSILEEDEPEDDPSMRAHDSSYLAVPEIRRGHRSEIRQPAPVPVPVSIESVTAAADIPIPSIERDPEPVPEMQPQPSMKEKPKASYAVKPSSGTIRGAPAGLAKASEEEHETKVRQSTVPSGIPVPVKRKSVSEAKPVVQCPTPPVTQEETAAPAGATTSVAPVSSDGASRVSSPEPAGPHEALSSHPVTIVDLVEKVEKRAEKIDEAVAIETPVEMKAEPETVSVPDAAPAPVPVTAPAPAAVVAPITAPKPVPAHVEPVNAPAVHSAPVVPAAPAVPVVSPALVQLPMSPPIGPTTTALAPIPGSPGSPVIGAVETHDQIPAVPVSNTRASSARHSTDIPTRRLSADYAPRSSSDQRHPKRSASINSVHSQRSISNLSAGQRPVERKSSTSTMHSMSSNPITTVPSSKLAYPKRRSNSSLNGVNNGVQVSDEDQLSDDSDIAEDSGRRRLRHRRQHPRPDKTAAVVAATEAMQARAISPHPFDEDDMASINGSINDSVNGSINGDLLPIGPHVNVQTRARSTPPLAALKINPAIVSGIVGNPSPTNSSPGLAPSPIPDNIPSLVHRRAASTDSSVRRRRLSRNPSGTELSLLADGATGQRSVSGESFVSLSSRRSMDSPNLGSSFVDGIPRPPAITKMEPAVLSSKHSIGSFSGVLGRLDSIAEAGGNKVGRRASSMSMQSCTSRRASVERPIVAVRAVSGSASSSSEARSRSRSQTYRRSAVINTAKMSSAHEDMKNLRKHYGMDDSTVELTGEIEVEVEVARRSMSKERDQEKKRKEEEERERDIEACTKALMGIRSVRHDLGRLERAVAGGSEDTSAILSEDEDDTPVIKARKEKAVVIHQEPAKAPTPAETKTETPKVVEVEEDIPSLHDLQQEIDREDAVLEDSDEDSDGGAKTLVPSTGNFDMLASRSWADNQAGLRKRKSIEKAVENAVVTPIEKSTEKPATIKTPPTTTKPRLAVQKSTSSSIALRITFLGLLLSLAALWYTAETAKAHRG